MFRTLFGDVAVQDLKRGDKVVVHVDGAEKFRHVISAGRAQCNVRPDLPLDQAGYPVRIVKDAISDGVTFRDMLITSEHCLFFRW
ncbi:Hint domain-containing protein [Acetobacter sacchari]|uniref:Hint domain-containing protein n=2 Tax=Acetobacter sacchari TaxID=2661687 RepID=A0ABS3M0M9_9PROT|nr:Hint domain-containing protein [Acetobacter sacchari]